MATRQSTVDFLLEQTAQAGTMRTTRMFGEYGLYCDEKVVAFICDDQLFLKPTAAGKTYLGAENIVEKPAYPGSKNYLFIAPDKWDERDWLSELVKISAAELPLPKPKTKSAPKSKKKPASE